MKFLIVLAVVVAAVVAAPPSTGDREAQVLKSDFTNTGVDGYGYGFETSNGIAAQESGQLKNVGTENEAIEVRGQFSYPGPDGVIYTVTYVANELGFQPSAPHIPQ